jgi:hypothetical protein
MHQQRNVGLRDILRWCQTVEGKEESHEPEDCVCNLDREFGGCKEQRKQTDVACHSQWAESTEVPAVVECNKAEGNNNQQDGFLVDVPAEEERCVSAESGSCNKVGPCRSEEELDECRLEKVVNVASVNGSGLGQTYNLSGKSQDECHAWCNVW